MAGKNRLCAVAFFSLIAMQGVCAHADSLVTTAGEFLIGEVHKTDTGYTVQTKDRLINVKASEVRTILFDRHPATAAEEGSSITGSNSTRVPTKPADPKVVGALLQQGQAAIAAGEFGDARNAFADAFAIDPKNWRAGRGLGLAYLKLGKPEKAAQPLLVASEGLPMDRSLAMSLAAALVATHDAMGAAKCVETYFQAHSDYVDEPVLNALGIALWQADPSVMHTQVFTDGVKMYSSLNAQLEATQPGKRRWGTEWLSAAEVNDRQKARHIAQAKVDETYNALQDAKAELKLAQTALTNATRLSPKQHSDREKQMSDAQSKVNTATTTQKAAQAEYDNADAELSKIPGPVFPSVIALTDADLLPTTPPAIASNSRVTRYGAGFAIAPDVVVTAAGPVDGASRVQIVTAEGKTMNATVLRMHHGDGLALLEVSGAKLPTLRIATSEKSGLLTCMTFPDVDPLTPVAKPIEIITGEPDGPWTAKFPVSPRLPGGPLLKNGAVVGVELGDRDSDLAAVPAATWKELISLVESEAEPAQVANEAKRAIVQVVAEH